LNDAGTGRGKGCHMRERAAWNNMWYGSREATIKGQGCEYYQAHKKKITAYYKSDKARDVMRKQKLSRSGWTAAEYDEAVIAQKGVCAICGNPPGSKRLCADHCHATGKRGKLLCLRCNLVLGYLEHPMRSLWDAYLKEVR
jgi:Recombination endonuclease VII